MWLNIINQLPVYVSYFNYVLYAPFFFPRVLHVTVECFHIFFYSFFPHNYFFIHYGDMALVNNMRKHFHVHVTFSFAF